MTTPEQRARLRIEELPASLPAWRRPLPFIYDSTVAETHFTNALDPEPRARNVFAFHRPETLADGLGDGAGGSGLQAAMESGTAATPSKQTFGFFNQNLVMEYGREQAVANGVNVNYDVYRIRTQVSEAGGKGDAGFVIDYRDKLPTKIFPGRTEVPKTLMFAKDDSHAEDIVKIAREAFGKGNEFALLGKSRPGCFEVLQQAAAKTQ